MAYKLKRGQIVRSHKGKTYLVKEFLGSGDRVKFIRRNPVVLTML